MSIFFDDLVPNLSPAARQTIAAELRNAISPACLVLGELVSVDSGVAESVSDSVGTIRSMIAKLEDRHA